MRVRLGLTTLVLLGGALGLAAAVRTPAVASALDARAGAGLLTDVGAQKALPVLERAASSRTSAVLLYHLGSARADTGDPTGAVEAFEAALLEPASPEVRRRIFHNLARVRLVQALAAPPGEAIPPALASVVFGREALRLRPDAAETRRNLALAERLLADHRANTPQAARDGGVSLTGAAQSAGASESGMGPERAATILDALGSSESSDLRAAAAARSDGVRRPTSSRRGPPW